GHDCLRLDDQRPRPDLAHDADFFDDARKHYCLRTSALSSAAIDEALDEQIWTDQVKRHVTEVDRLGHPLDAGPGGRRRRLATADDLGRDEGQDAIDQPLAEEGAS